MVGIHKYFNNYHLTSDTPKMCLPNLKIGSNENCYIYIFILSFVHTSLKIKTNIE